MDKSIGTPPSLEQKKALPKLWQRRWKHNCLRSGGIAAEVYPVPRSPSSSCGKRKEHVQSIYIYIYIYFQYIYIYIYIHFPSKKKKSQTLLFSWTTFSFQDGMHSPWHQFHKLLQCHNIYSCLELS